MVSRPPIALTRARTLGRAPTEEARRLSSEPLGSASRVCVSIIGTAALATARSCGDGGVHNGQLLGHLLRSVDFVCQADVVLLHSVHQAAVLGVHRLLLPPVGALQLRRRRLQQGRGSDTTHACAPRPLSTHLQLAGGGCVGRHAVAGRLRPLPGCSCLLLCCAQGGGGCFPLCTDRWREKGRDTDPGVSRRGADWRRGPWHPLDPLPAR